MQLLLRRNYSDYYDMYCRYCAVGVTVRRLWWQWTGITVSSTDFSHRFRYLKVSLGNIFQELQAAGNFPGLQELQAAGIFLDSKQKNRFYAPKIAAKDDDWDRSKKSKALKLLLNRLRFFRPWDRSISGEMLWSLMENDHLLLSRLRFFRPWDRSICLPTNWDRSVSGELLLSRVRKKCRLLRCNFYKSENGCIFRKKWQ